MTSPKRYEPRAVAGDQGQPIASMREDENGGFVDQSEYEALVQAFAIYMREGMDRAQQVLEVLKPHLGDDAAGFVATLLAEAEDDEIVLGGKN